VQWSVASFWLFTLSNFCGNFLPVRQLMFSPLCYTINIVESAGVCVPLFLREYENFGGNNYGSFYASP